MKPNYKFRENGEFVIGQYDTAKPFASFLPGVAGIDGIPMWSFYVNRGQAMASFGVGDRNGTIMEFFPANVMYKNVERGGFRTFIKVDGCIHEIFSSMSADPKTRTMHIDKNVVRVAEENITLGLRVTVTYFTMPQEDYAAIVRRVEVQSLDGVLREFEIMDGLVQILPFGMGNSEYQAMSNLARAWFDVFNIKNHIPFYKMRATAKDSDEVGELNQGNFYLAFSSQSGGLLPPLYDMDVLFGQNTALTKPDGWDCDVGELLCRSQVAQNKVSGGFAGERARVENGSYVLYTVIGHIENVDHINAKREIFTPAYIEAQYAQATRLVDDLTKDVCTQTAVGLFDRYISQSYLDNFLRGGYPLVFPAGGKNHVYHVFSRKHGDLEREYNFFSLEPAYYSQGNGNYRDVAQNRRNDVLLKPAVGDFDVRHFMSLIQADGYNPLHVKGCTFLFDMHAWEQISPLVLSGRAGVKRLLTGSFTPGSLISYVAEHSAELTVSREELLDRVLSHSEQQLEAAFGEGYWSDHWTYLMDLIEAYLSVYPDNRERFLFDDNSYRYFRSPVYVLPRADKYVLVNGRVRQYGAVMEEKDTGADSEQDCWLCDRLGAVYHTNLYAKLVSLALNKFTSLDPCGMGIEMEGGKPGWNDAMNGLPGLFGSGISETAELLRIVDFLIRGAHQYSREIMLPVEMSHLLKRTEDVVDENLSGALSDFECWDRISSAKEDYRLGIRRGINGGEAAYGTEEMAAFFKKLENKLSRGMDKALIYGGGLPPTYFTYEAKAYKLVDGKSNPVNGYPNVVVTAFECRQLPLFLEAPARVLKTVTKPDRARELYDRLRTSDIYDKKLGMYKTSVPLERESPEIGRQKAFTPGWLERESVFLHMEYKYLYAMLKAGLYDEFFADIKTAFVPFMSPEVYGRSTLENCSFIASSVNPDKEVHGRGFVARLSGSTAEVISIWLHMMCGKQVFSFADGELRLSLQPVLPGWLFDENGRVEFMFLGGTRVRYINPNKTDTYGEHGAKPYRYVLTDRHSNTQECVGCITGQLAQMVRDGRIAEIEAYLK